MVGLGVKLLFEWYLLDVCLFMTWGFEAYLLCLKMMTMMMMRQLQNLLERNYQSCKT